MGILLQFRRGPKAQKPLMAPRALKTEDFYFEEIDDEQFMQYFILADRKPYFSTDGFRCFRKRSKVADCINVLISYLDTSFYGVFSPSAFRRFTNDLKKYSPEEILCLYLRGTIPKTGGKLKGVRDYSRVIFSPWNRKERKGKEQEAGWREN